MKQYKNLLTTCLYLILFIGCREERELEPARLDTTAEIFTDTFVGLGTNFYFPFVGDGARPDVFSVDETEGFESDASIRIDVPNANDPLGNFAGASFVVDGGARDLRDYNALTFYAKASQAATLGTVGFGLEFQASRNNLDLTTNWQKYIIPIPDPSRLSEIATLFLFSAGGIGDVPGQEVGYTFWIDELKFENLFSVAQPLAQIFNGEDRVETSFNGVTIPVSGASVLYNVAGAEVAVNASPTYFNFNSSDPSVATVDASGTVTVTGAGTTEISASLGQGDNQTDAAGRLTVNSSGAFDAAPIPTRDASNVVSIFSDAYTNVPVDNYNGFFQFATTQGGAIAIGDENIISYTDLNFVSINMFNIGGANATGMTHIHLDVNIREALDPGDFLRLEIINDDGGSTTSGSVQLGDVNPLVSNQWIQFDIPLTSFSGLGNPANDVDLIFFVSDATISSIYVDNVYFYTN